MRKSRLYLGLSIVSLVVAIGLGELAKDCDYSCQTVCSRSVSIEEHLENAYTSLQTRDFDSMARHAEEIVERSDSSIGHALSAYASRGKGNFAEAIDAYTTAIDIERRSGAPDNTLIIDCYVGRADCYLQTGELKRARHDLAMAKSGVFRRVKVENNESAHYQMACYYAVHSRVMNRRSSSADVEQSLHHLRIAAAKGFDNRAHMMGDLDLDALHTSDEFRSMLIQ